MRRWAWIGVTVVLIVAAAALGLRGLATPSGGDLPPSVPGASQPPPPGGPPGFQEAAVAVEVARVERRSIVERASYHGTLRPRRTVSLTPKIGGRVAEVLVDVGDRVEAGQVLLRLDAAEMEAQVRQAEAALAAARAQRDRLLAGASEEELEQARAAVRQASLQLETAQSDLERMEELFQKRGVSAQAYEAAQTQAALAAAQLQSAEARLQALEAGARAEDIQAAEAQVRQAEAGLELARAQLANASLTAPFAGVVSSRNAEVGALLSPGSPALTLTDLEELSLLLHLPGTEVLRLQPGAPAELAVEGFPDRTFQARVYRIDPVADPQTNLFGVELRLSDPDGLLRAGLSASASLPLRSARDVLAVPRAALVERAGELGVYVVEGGLARFQPLQTGLLDDTWVEVRSGLSEGATVVTAGKGLLQNGARVRVQAGPVASAASTENAANTLNASTETSAARQGDLP